jgi:alpha-L-fucosidase
MPKKAARKFEASSWESFANYPVPKWYQDAKFGIFIHWGVYSVPAFGSEWYPRHMYRKGTKENLHHVKTWGPLTKFGYKDFIPLFKAEKFDPAAWAALFKKSGAKYVVPVAEHHDGFAMYDTKLSKWNAARMGPKRDVIGELSAAIRKEGLHFGVSSHRAEHWWYYGDGMATDSDVRRGKHKDFYGPATPMTDDQTTLGNRKTLPFPDKAHLDNWLARTSEIVDKYQPELIYFDWWIQHFAFDLHLRKFAAYYYNKGAQRGHTAIINYKNDAMPVGSAVFDVERGQLKGIRPEFWQTDTAVAKNSWGFTEGQDYKTETSIIHDLIDIVSKNGTLLLNVGPRPDGTIPEREVEMLTEFGAWLALNGEAIHGTRPWKIFGEGPTEIIEGTFNDVKRAAFTPEDFRFTQKGRALYALALAWPEDGKLAIKSLAAGAEHAPKIGSVELLGHHGKLAWTQDAAALNIALPPEKPCAHAWVFKIS